MNRVGFRATATPHDPAQRFNPNSIPAASKYFWHPLVLLLDTIRDPFSWIQFHYPCSISGWRDSFVGGLCRGSIGRRVEPHLVEPWGNVLFHFRLKLSASVAMPKTRQPMNSIPSIDTQRLTLRRHRLEDFDECAAMWGDPEVTRYIGGRPFSQEDVWSKLLRYAGLWSLMGFGFWVIRERTSGRFIGEVGFADFKRDIQPSLEGAPEIGWALAPWAWGKGFATEAVRASVEWGITHLVSKRTVCLIGPENLASIRVAEKCGYKEFKRTTYRGQPIIVFERW
jgi:RimJ/RimL family protein N-acetyltransferase